MEPEGAGQPAASDSGGDAALRPGDSYTEVGEEAIPIRLTKVTRRYGGQALNKISGKLDVWYEEQEFVPKEEE